MMMEFRENASIGDSCCLPDFQEPGQGLLTWDPLEVHEPVKHADFHIFVFS